MAIKNFCCSWLEQKCLLSLDNWDELRSTALDLVSLLSLQMKEFYKELMTVLSNDI